MENLYNNVELEKIIETQIFKRILEANGLVIHVEFEWGQPSQEQINIKISQIIKILESEA